MSNWFWIDFISTVPVGMLFDEDRSTILKGSKAIRLIRFVKLLRVIKISKINVTNGETTRLLYKLIKSNQGYLDLVKNMGLIYLFAHY